MTALIHEDKTRCFGCNKEFPTWSTGGVLFYERYELVRVPLGGENFPQENSIYVCESHRGGPITPCERRAWSRIKKTQVCFGCGGGNHHEDNSEMRERRVRRHGMLCDRCLEALTKGDEAVTELKRSRAEIVDEVVAYFIHHISGRGYEPGWGIHNPFKDNPFKESPPYDSEEYRNAEMLFQEFRSFISDTAKTNYQAGVEYGTKLLQRLNDGSMSSRTFHQSIAENRSSVSFEETIDTVLDSLKAAAMRWS